MSDEQIGLSGSFLPKSATHKELGGILSSQLFLLLTLLHEREGRQVLNQEQKESLTRQTKQPSNNQKEDREFLLHFAEQLLIHSPTDFEVLTICSDR